MTMQPGNGTQAPVTSTELAKRSDDDLFRFGLEPQGLEGALSLCKQIAEAGIFPNKDGANASPASLLVRLMTGRSLNVPAMISLNHVYEVHGRPSISARLKTALCLRHPECQKFELLESDNVHAIYLVKRAGMAEAKSFKYTIEDARLAQLVKKDSAWEKTPRRMLEARASSHAADIIFPDACMGLPTVDEVDDDLRPGEIRGEVVPPTVPARNWEQESDAIKAALMEAVKNADKGKMTETRKKMKAFLEETTPAVGEDLQRFYNMIKDSATKEAPPAATAPQAKAQPPQGTYLPPNQRGDAYDGPDKPPPPPFG